MDSGLLIKLDAAIALVEDGLATKSEVMNALAFKQQLGAFVRHLNTRFEKAAIAWIEKNGEIEEGTTRWYVGKVIDRKCKSVKETIGAILEQSGGDLDPLVTLLSSQPFKEATTIDFLGEKAKALWDTAEKKDLKDGAPRKKLKGVPKALAGKPEAEDINQFHEEA